MRNPVSKRIIIVISILVALLHILIGPDYNGFAKVFVHSYLIDIVLPFNAYLLTQIAFRKKLKVKLSRTLGAASTIIFGCLVETLQYFNIDFLGNTFDPIDIVMYVLGVTLAIMLDLMLFDKLEKNS